MPTRRVAALLLAVGLGVSACGGGTSTPTVLKMPPEAATAPPLRTAPAGTVVDLHANMPEGIAFDERLQAVVVDARPNVELQLDTAGHPTKTYHLSGSGRHVRLLGDIALVPLEGVGTLALVDLDHHTIRDVHVDGGPHDVTPLPGNRALVASEQGGVASVVTADGAVSQTLPCGVQPATVVDVGNLAGCIDVRGQILHRYDVTPGQTAHSDGTLPVGQGPTHVVDLGGGLVGVADALGHDIDLVSITTLTVVGRVPLPAAPEGLAADRGRHRLWVTMPGINTLDRIDLSGTSGEVSATFPTVRQANSLAVDTTNGTVYVLGRADGRLQILRG
jgi:DNA-binding beta-propeller fold protein YncE